MIAVITSAHVSFLYWLKMRNSHIVSDIFSHRRIRCAQYIESIEKLNLSRDCFSDIYLLECISNGVPGYLRKLNGLKFAVGANSADSPNKGVKEFVNLADFVRNAGIGEDEKLFKMTGRYLLHSNEFPVYCRNSHGDVIVKKDDDLWGTNGKGVHTFMFACKAKVITSFADWLLMGDRRTEVGMTPIEWIFREYIENQGLKIDYYS